MWKLTALACTVVFVTLIMAARPTGEFSKYKAVEAYEIRPGILMMPKYSSDGRVCEIGLERRHYSPTEVTLYSSLTRGEIDQIVDELAPVAERGPRSKEFPREMSTLGGFGMTTAIQYENVSILIFSSVSRPSKKDRTLVDTVAAVVRWKNRGCQ